MFGRITSRRVVIVVKATFRLLLALLTLFVIWWEFPEIFQSGIFVMILLAWFAYAVIFFMDDWIKAREDTIEDKLDVLINEIRQDRNERRNNDK